MDERQYSENRVSAELFINGLETEAIAIRSRVSPKMAIILILVIKINDKKI